jgi:tetratricopeptide (TPR) repeat protein
MSSKIWQSPGYIALACLLLAYVFQVNLDSYRFYTPRKSAVTVSLNYYIEPQPPSPTAAKLTSFGATEFLADWYWLKTIQYYGGGDPSGRYRKLAELFNLVTELSPKFTAAYQTGLLVLPGEGFVDEAIALGQKGQRNLPDRWEMPYYTGLVYHISKKDYASAAAEFEKAAALPGAPATTKLFAAIYYKEADSRQTAYEIFKTIYETSDNDFAKERAKKYVEHLSIYFYLQDAVVKFQSQFHRYPQSLDELISRKIIEAIPPSPLNQTFTVDPTTGAISEAKSAEATN